MKKSFYFVTFSPVLKHCSRICFFVVTLSSTDCLSHLQVLNPLYWNEEWTIYLLATLLGTIARPPFSFRTAIILCGTDSTRCWKHSSDILVHFDTTVSHIYRRFLAAHPWWGSITSQRCSVGLWSGDYGGHLSAVSSLGCSTTLSWCDFCDMMCCPAEGSHQ